MRRPYYGLRSRNLGRCEAEGERKTAIGAGREALSMGRPAEELSTITLSWLKPGRALLAFLVVSLALQGAAKNWGAIFSEGQRGKPAIDASGSEPKLRDLGFLLFVDGRAYRPPVTVEDALAGGARAIIFDGPATGASSELERGAKPRTPIFLYDQASDSHVRVFVDLDTRKAGEFLGDPAMAEGDLGDHDSF
jgi:hypothetical protein